MSTIAYDNSAMEKKNKQKLKKFVNVIQEY